MYVFAFHLNNFRSFDDFWVFPNRNVNVIVGPNNSGKTSLLDALALVLDPRVNLWRPGSISRFDFHNVNLGEPMELTVWLKPVVEETGGEVAYKESDEIKKAFFDKLSMWQMETFSRLDHLNDKEHHPDRVVPLTVDPMETSIPHHEDLLAIRLRAEWDASREIAEIEVGVIDQMGNMLDSFSSKGREILGFTLLPSDRDPVRELSLNRRSVLSQLLDEDEVSQALRKILQSLEQAKKPLIEQKSVRHVLESLENLAAPEFFGALMADLSSKFTLTFLNGELWRLRGATSIATSAQLDSEEPSLPLEYQGDGAQNLILLFHLIEMLRTAGKSSIVAVEEPEQNLEPSLAKCLFGELCSLSEAESAQGQIFATTHSPALISELKGPDSLLIFSRTAKDDDKEPQDLKWRMISARCLSQDTRKKLDQRRERYVNTLFARQALIVEGDSEIGFLPVAFRYFSRSIPYENPYHLGLEVMNGDSKGEALKHAKILKGYGRECHLLLDYDGPDEDFEEQIKSRFDGEVHFITCWPKERILDFTKGCDLEVILAACVPPGLLFEALKCAYEDAGHPLKKSAWDEACRTISDEALVKRFPPVYGQFDLNGFALETLGDKRAQQGFLLTLLHGPHSCKSVKDMRIIAEILSEYDAIPRILDDLRGRILKSMSTPKEIDHDEPYLVIRT